MEPFFITTQFQSIAGKHPERESKTWQGNHAQFNDKFFPK